MQVGLVVEADGRGDVRDQLAVEQPAAGRFHPPADEVAVPWHPDFPAEAADEVGRVGVQLRARLAQRDPCGQPAFEQVAGARRPIRAGRVAPAGRAAGRSGR